MREQRASVLRREALRGPGNTVVLPRKLEQSADAMLRQLDPDAAAAANAKPLPLPRIGNPQQARAQPPPLPSFKSGVPQPAAAARPAPAAAPAPTPRSAGALGSLANKVQKMVDESIGQVDDDSMQQALAMIGKQFGIDKGTLGQLESMANRVLKGERIDQVVS